MEDTDVPVGTKVHWMIYGFGPDAPGVDAGRPRRLKLPNGVRQGGNDFGETGYTRPNPPKGTSHHYSFKLYALPTELVLKAGARKREFWKAVQEAKALAVAELVGLFNSEMARPTQIVTDEDQLSNRQKERLDYPKK